MVRGVILADYTDKGVGNDPPWRLRAVKREAAKLGIHIKELFSTPRSHHDAAMVIEAEVREPIEKFISTIQSLDNMEVKFIRAFSDDKPHKIV